MAVNVVNTVTRAAAWLAGVVEGLFGGLFKFRRGASAPTLAVEGSFCELRLSLVGKSREQIAAALGVPPTASLGFGAQARHHLAGTFWQATMWYYPFDQKHHKAIAIRFEGDWVREVEFIGAP